PADLVVLVFHPPGFLVLHLADSLQGFRLPHPPAEGVEVSPYVGGLVAMEEDGFALAVYHSQVTQAHVYPSYPFPGTRCCGNRHRQGQIPPASFAVQLCCPLLDSSVQLFKDALLPVRSGKRYTDPPNMSWETGRPELARLL